MKVEDTKQVGTRVVVKLTLKNTFKERIESARATLFLLNDGGKVVGQATHWVIGDQRRNSIWPLRIR